MPVGPLDYLHGRLHPATHYPRHHVPVRTHDMDQLDADTVPLPLRGVLGQVDAQILQRVRQHERAEHRHVGGRRGK